MKESNPLKIVLKALSGFMMVIGLSSLAEGIVEWVGFVVSLINAYQLLAYPLWDFLFAWLPFDIPSWVKDYLTIGLIWSVGFYNANRTEEFAENVGSWIGAIVFSPVWVITVAGQFLYLVNPKESEEDDRKEAIVTFQ